MITNIVCSVVVSLVTNMSSMDNQQGCSICEGIRVNHWALGHELGAKCMVPYVAATERTDVVKVVRVTEVKFEFGGPWSCRKEEVVSEKRKRYVLKSDWVEVK